MSESISISSGIADRYATAVFDLSKEEKLLGELEAGNDVLEAALRDSDDLRTMIASPLYSRAEQSAAIAGVAEKLGLPALLQNTLSLMASKRRLFVLPQLVTALRERIAEEKGEVTAEVRSATALTDAQLEDLKGVIGKSVGKDVKLNTSVDESLIGGLVVKVGSKMIDTSIRSKLNALQNTMKEVG